MDLTQVHAAPGLYDLLEHGPQPERVRVHSVVHAEDGFLRIEKTCTFRDSEGVPADGVAAIFEEIHARLRCRGEFLALPRRGDASCGDAGDTAERRGGEITVLECALVNGAPYHPREDEARNEDECDDQEGGGADGTQEEA